MTRLFVSVISKFLVPMTVTLALWSKPSIAALNCHDLISSIPVASPIKPFSRLGLTGRTLLSGRYANFKVVDSSKEVYRSAQLGPNELGYALSRLNIKRIINLRGSNPTQRWYQDEVRVANQLGIELFDIPLTASRAPTPEEVTAIRVAFQNSPGPILIHCKAGADRTGLVTALYQIEVMNLAPQDAFKSSLSFWNLHVRSAHPELDNFILTYKRSGNWN